MHIYLLSVYSKIVLHYFPTYLVVKQNWMFLWHLLHKVNEQFSHTTVLNFIDCQYKTIDKAFFLDVDSQTKNTFCDWNEGS